MTEKPSTSQSGALAPAAAFAFLLLLVAAAGAAVYLLAGPNETEPGPTGNPSGTASTPDHQLTDAEAVSVFEVLDKRRLTAIEKRDDQLADSVYVDGSKVEERILDDIGRLVRTGTRVRTTFETTRLAVTRNLPGEVRLRQTVVVEAAFRRMGQSVDKVERPERQVIDWVLTYVDGQWLISDAVVREAELI